MDSKTMITIPFDILQSIVDTLATGKDHSTLGTLKAASLTCHAMVPLCRTHLFSSVKLRRVRKSSQHRYIGDLLSQSPDIARYIRELYWYWAGPGQGVDDQKVFDLLRERSCLQSIGLFRDPYFAFRPDWNALPASVQASLVSILQLNTVTHIKIESIINIPRTVFFFCAQLTNLQLTFVGMTSDNFSHLPSRRKVPAPRVLKAEERSYDALAILLKPASRDTGPTVDFSRLKNAHVEMKNGRDFVVVKEVLRMATQLESLRLFSLETPLPLGGLAASLSASSNNTLKSAIFESMIDGDDFDPLCGLPDELRMMAGNNVLEEIVVDACVQTDCSCQTDSRDWSDVDEVLAGPGFPKLRRVKFKFNVAFYCRDPKDLLNSMTKGRFPKLSESSNITFYFTVNKQRM